MANNTPVQTLRRRTKRERLAYLEGWLAGLQFTLDHTVPREGFVVRLNRRVSQVRLELEKARKVIH